MSKHLTNPTPMERLRGMMLMSAYGDALGAEHENTQSVHPAPFPEQLPQQNLKSNWNRWGYWATTAELGPTARGVTTDDTAFKLFILHPWLQQIFAGNSQLGEPAFIRFLGELNSTTLEPGWISQPRDAQIDSWLDMYRAWEVSEDIEFFSAGVPTVFGFFMFQELAAMRTHCTPVENYHFFRAATVLDQGYASAATGFLSAITSQAFSSDPSERFDRWLIDQSNKLIEELLNIDIDRDAITVIQQIVVTMSELGKRLCGESPHDFMVAFEESVIATPNPPFMNEPFMKPVHDPFRMLAEIFAATSYAEGDPFLTMQPLAFGSGDSDTVCAFLGTLQGIWFGEKILRQNSNLNKDFEIVEGVLYATFKVDLDRHAELFLNLQNESNPLV